MNVRKITLTLHLIGGMPSALFLIALGVSGGLLVFEGEIDHRLNRALTWVKTEGSARPLDELCAAVEHRHPGTRVDAVMPSSDSAIAYKMRLRPAGQGKAVTVAVNQYTGEELGSLEAANTFMSKVHQFHTNLLRGPSGKQITAARAMFLLALTISGLILWRPRKLWKLSVLRRKRAAALS